MEEAAQTLGITASWVLKELEDLFMVAKAAVKPKLNSKTGKAIKDEEGNPVFTRDHTTMLKALELIGKHLGMFDQGQLSSDNSDYMAHVASIRDKFKVVK
jgi:hypothetical protein